jgi:hypothetical protein
MATTKSKQTTKTPRHPERKFGPFHGGVGVAVWLNQVQTDDGPRYFRTVTINPRRFRDTKTGEWKDAGSLRSTDLPALVLALEAARAYMATTPLPGEPIEEEEEVEDAPPQDNGDIPF